MKKYEYEEIYEFLKSINKLDLVSQLMFRRHIDEIKKILSMKEWEDPKFQGLLTSNIWNSNYEYIKKILSMKEWEASKFQGLLTSTIWNSNYEDIIKKIYFPYWNENKYLQLLTPSIFSISINNIVNGIEVLKKYGIDNYVTNRCLRLPTDFLKKLLEYLVSNNIELVTYNMRTKQIGLNPMLNCSKSELKKKYNIDLNKIDKGAFSK